MLPLHQALFSRPTGCSALGALNIWLRVFFLQEEASAGQPMVSTPQPAPAGSAVVTGPSASSSDLAPGWFEAVDPTYNHPYWYNPTTGERSWTRSSAGGSKAAAVPAADGLPAGWSETTDPVSGTVYYFNAGTGDRLVWCGVLSSTEFYCDRCPLFNLNKPQMQLRCSAGFALSIAGQDWDFASLAFVRLLTV